MASKKLCINPACSAHCDVIHGEHGWQFENGFRMTLTKSQLTCFDPNSDENYCGRCIGLANKLKAITKERDALIEVKKSSEAALQGVINSACHPAIAIRVLMVELAPIRKALKKSLDFL